VGNPGNQDFTIASSWRIQRIQCDMMMNPDQRGLFRTKNRGFAMEMPWTSEVSDPSPAGCFWK
jgi:hypothetical protein